MTTALKKIIPKVIGTYFNLLSWVAPGLVGRKVMNVFRKPREGEIRPKDAEVLATAEASAILDHSMGSIATYTWNGSGEKTVVLLHGWESNAARWFALIPRLVEKGLKVVAVDAPAHGASSGQYFDMVQYRAALHSVVEAVRPHYLVGHSLGGKVIGFYSDQYPMEAFEKLVLMGVPSDLRPMVEHFKGVLGLSKRAGRAFDKTFEAMFQLGIDEISVARYCASIPVPTLVIHDEGDPLALIKDGHRIADALPNSERFITQGLGHSLQGEPVFDRVVEWLTDSHESVGA